MSEDVDIAGFLSILSQAPQGKYLPIDKYRDFRRVFLGSEQGRRVLFELLRMTGANKSIPGPGPVDPYRAMEALGRRNVGLALIGTIVDEPKELPKEANRE